MCYLLVDVWQECDPMPERTQGDEVMTTMRMLSNARKELHAWDALVTERSAVAKAAREAHDQAIEARDKWIELVKTIEADLGTTGED